MLISMQDFLKTGSLGPVHLKMGRAEVERHLGQPEDWSAMLNQQRRPVIWKYGSIEIYFSDNEDVVAMIFIDDFAAPHHGVSQQLDFWLLKHRPSLIELQKELAANDITYTTAPVPGLADNVYLITAAGVHLQLAQEVDGMPRLVSCFIR
ncbi:MAG: hypothetical protein JO316_08825 [Abitibacteriaceae bacterium]|nr:hypothetical protein [Abditibacteriaceae bacterium]